MSDPGLLEDAARHRAATRDGVSAVGGIVLAITVHLGVAGFALRAGAHEGNIARSIQQAQEHPPEEEIIEGALLRQGGGGENFDPRTIHRQPPIRSEVAAAPTGGLAKNQNPTPPPPNPNARRDPNALITGRDILGTGNQDLAEQLHNLAQNEAAAGTQPGPGDPDGSVNGTETDPARAGHGAQAKIRSFLERNIHLPANAPSSTYHFVLGITISDDGSYISRAEIRTGSGDSFVDGDINGQMAQLVQDHTAIPELTDEEKAAIAGHSYRVPYNPH